MKVGYHWDPAYQNHLTSAIHRESPARIGALAPEKIRPYFSDFVLIEGWPDLHRNWLQTVHSPSYLAKIESLIRGGARRLDADTRVSIKSFDIAVYAIGGILRMARAIFDKRVHRGFCAVRPPGHHAGAEFARGFCLLNNAALAARYVQQAFGWKRVLIIDWDVHAGDGTMSIFYEDPSVHVASIHEDGLFGLIGQKGECGKGRGKGATYNVPVPSSISESNYLQAFTAMVEKAASQCEPELIIISCGFDAHYSDPVGHLKLGYEAFAEMTRTVTRLAEKYCEGRVLSMLEGGYNIETLPRCVAAHLATLAEQTRPVDQINIA